MAGLGKVCSYVGKKQIEVLLLSQNLFKRAVGLLIFQSLVRQPLFKSLKIIHKKDGIIPRNIGKNVIR